MSKKSSSASNDPMTQWSAMMQAQNAANQQSALGQNWLDFAREQYGVANQRQAGIDDLTKQVVNKQLAAQDQSQQWATEDRNRYKSIFQPMQDRFIEKANNWDSAGNQAAAAAAAKADVTTNAALQDQQRTRQMAAMGINPTSGRYAGVERAVDVETGLAAAGAQNNARNQLCTQALGLQGDALNIGNGLPSQALSAVGGSVDAGNAAQKSVLGAQNSFLANKVSWRAATPALAGSMAMQEGRGATSTRTASIISKIRTS